MSTIMPKDEALRKAIKWISQQLRVSSQKTISQLINEAALQFNLSPKDSDFLLNFYQSEQQ